MDMAPDHEIRPWKTRVLFQNGNTELQNPGQERVSGAADRMENGVS